MAVEVVERAPTLGTTGRTPRPGFIDRALKLVDDLPGPAAVAWAAIGVGAAAVGHLIVWSNPERPFGVIHHDVAAPALVIGWFGWLITYLNKVAARAFDDFSPALGDPDLEAQHRAALTTIPDRYAVLGAVGTIAVVSIGYYVFVRPTRGPVPPEIEVVSGPLWAVMAVLLGVLIVHTIRQLRIVSHLSAVARKVDIFKPAPLNALARLTAVSALGLIAFVGAFVLFSLEQPLAYVVQEAVLLAIAVGSFVLPLRVMHARLVVEKQRLLSANQDRLKTVLARIHRHVDAGDLAESEQLHHALTAVLAEREVLVRLQTWPWSAGTFRGFTSALLLPILLIVFTQFVDRLL